MMDSLLYDRIAESLKAKGIIKATWEFHLDEMTDEEITYMLNRERMVFLINEDREERPEVSDRERAKWWFELDE